MYDLLKTKLNRLGILSGAPLSLSDCRLLRPYLLEREQIPTSGSVLMMAVPYLTPACLDNNRNLSVYAVSRDYHLFFKDLFASLLREIHEEFPSVHAAGFADHAPIDEVHAAVLSGIGVLGENRLVITEPHGSFVFLGGIYTDLPVSPTPNALPTCEKCGACRASCPAQKNGICLSSLTQKKGTLSEEETETLRRQPLVWGCDTCLFACPHNRAAVEKNAFTSIRFFYEKTLSSLDSDTLNTMSEEEFASRAYSWRGRETVARNLSIKK